MEYFFNIFTRKKMFGTIYLIIVILLFTFYNFIFISEAQAVSLNPGDIIATHYRTAEIFLVDPVTGDLTLISSGGILIEPSGVTLDSSGDILIADMLKGIIRIEPITGYDWQRGMLPDVGQLDQTGHNRRLRPSPFDVRQLRGAIKQPVRGRGVVGSVPPGAGCNGAADGVSCAPRRGAGAVCPDCGSSTHRRDAARSDEGVFRARPL